MIRVNQQVTAHEVIRMAVCTDHYVTCARQGAGVGGFKGTAGISLAKMMGERTCRRGSKPTCQARRAGGSWWRALMVVHPDRSLCSKVVVEREEMLWTAARWHSATAGKADGNLQGGLEFGRLSQSDRWFSRLWAMHLDSPWSKRSSLTLPVVLLLSFSLLYHFFLIHLLWHSGSFHSI